MLIALGAVLAVWLLLPAAAYALRRAFGVGPWPLSMLALLAWGGCAALSIRVLGPGWQGVAGAAGMLVPLVAAVAIAFA